MYHNLAVDDVISNEILYIDRLLLSLSRSYCLARITLDYRLGVIYAASYLAIVCTAAATMHTHTNVEIHSRIDIQMSR